MSKKVLIVCYYWPPAGGPGVQRWLNFVKYLPSFGYDPVVFIPENASYPIVDENLLNEVPDNITILRAPINEPYKWGSMLSRKHTKTISAGIVPKEGKQSLLQKLMLYIRGNFFIPDARVSWVKPSVKRLVPYIEAEGIETVITTGPPHSLHLIGKGLKQSCYIGETEKNLHWITDFRDPWTTIGYHDKLKMGAAAKAKHKTLETSVLNEADQIIVTSPTTQRDFQEITYKSVHLITNGYDDFLLDQDVQLDTTFSLVHIGSLLSDRNPKILWKTLASLKSEYPDFENDLEIQLTGKVSSEVVESIKSFGLESQLTLKGYVSHQEALILQRKAQVLLLIEIDSEQTRAIIPGKVFEYLNAGRPILGIGPSNADVEQIITETQSGNYFDYTNEQGLKNHLISLYKKFLNGNLVNSVTSVEKYHRKSLTKELATILDNK